MTDTATDAPQADALAVETPQSEAAPVGLDAEMDAAFDAIESREKDEAAQQDEKAADKAAAKETKKADKAVEAEEGADDEGDDESEEGAEEGKAAEADKPTPPEGLSYLPKEITEHWAEIPEAAREKIAEAHLSMSRKVMDAGRIQAGLAPIKAELESTMQQFPEYAQMKPEQVAADIRELATTRAQLTRNPVGTLMAVAQQMGVTDALRQAFAGQPQGQQGQHPQQQQPRPQQQPRQQAQMTPEQYRAMISGTVEQTLDQRQTMTELQSWVSDNDLSDQQLTIIAPFVDHARSSLGEKASHRDILDAALDMARGVFKAPESPAPATVAQADPEEKRAEAAVKAATSKRIVSKGTSPGPRSFEQDLDAALDKTFGS